MPACSIDACRNAKEEGWLDITELTVTVPMWYRQISGSALQLCWPRLYGMEQGGLLVKVSGENSLLTYIEGFFFHPPSTEIPPPLPIRHVPLFLADYMGNRTMSTMHRAHSGFGWFWALSHPDLTGDTTQQHVPQLPSAVNMSEHSCVLLFVSDSSFISIATSGS